MRQVSFNQGSRHVDLLDTMFDCEYDVEQYEWVVTFDEKQFYFVSYVSQTPELKGPETMVFECDENGTVSDWSKALYKNDLHTPQLGRDDAFLWLKFQHEYMK